jgi:organic radical activating enzyme
LIDNDLKKSGKIFNGVSCFSVSEAIKIILPSDLILISVMDIQDVISGVESNFPENKKFYLGDLLEGVDVFSSFNSTGKTSEFLAYTLNAVRVCHSSYQDKKLSFARSVDIVITEKCSLKCKDCSNLMQFYSSPEDHSYSKVSDGFSELVNSIDSILEVRLIGGEPFMNKEIYEFIDFFMLQEKILKVVVYTNATIKLKDEKLEKYSNNPKLVFSITDYGPLSKATNLVLNVLNNLGIAYRSEPPNNWTDSGRIIEERLDKNSNQEIFEKCCAKNTFTLMSEKLFRCPFAANAEKLNAIPSSETNGIFTNSHPTKMKAFIENETYIDACAYCNGRSHDMLEIVPAIQAKAPMHYIKINS